MAKFIRAAAAALGCDEAMVALHAICVCGGALGASRAVKLKSSWIEFAIFWAIVVAESGGHKSPAWRIAVRSLWKAQDQLRQRWKEEMKQWLAQPEDERDEERKPKPRTIVSNDTTVERAAELLQNNPHGIVVTRDELSAWFSQMTKYRRSGSDGAEWLEFFSGGRKSVHRKTGQDRDIEVHCAVATIFGTIQPRILRSCFSEENRESGMAARFLLVAPPQKKKEWNDVEIDSRTQERFDELVLWLASLPFAKEETREPLLVGLTAEAKRLWVGFYNRFARTQYEADSEDKPRLAKLEGYCARFALLDHTIRVFDEGRDQGQIQADSVENAIKLTRWFFAEGARVQAVLGESDQDRDRRRLIEKIHRRGGTISVRDLQQSNARLYPTSKDAEAALLKLQELGLGLLEDRVYGKQNQTQKVFVATPVIQSDTSDTSERSAEQPASDTSNAASDTSAETAENPEENSQVSEVSDCLTGSEGANPAGEEVSRCRTESGEVSEASDTSTTPSGPRRTQPVQATESHSETNGRARKRRATL